MDGDVGQGSRLRQRSLRGSAWSRWRLARSLDSRAIAVGRRWGIALAGAGLLLLGGSASRVSAEALAACGGDGIDQAGMLDAACCPSDVLSTYWPMRSQQLTQTFCQLLMFPTATPANDDFSDRIVDGSLSSDSRLASADAMTLPSLWWNRDSLPPRLGGRRLVQSWISYQIEDSATPVVDVLVNSQIWSVLTYNERYAVLNQFGTAARSFGYNLRFLQGNARSYRMVGLYACEFDSQPVASVGSVATVYGCSANLDATRIVQIQRQLVAAGQRRLPTPTAQSTATDESI